MDAVRGNSLVWLLLTILPITGFDVRAGEKPIPYISPGFRVGYEFGKDLTVGLKISLGVNEEGNYYNITLGVRAVSRRDLASRKETYSYCQFQAGTPLNEIHGGGGIGFAVSGKDMERRVDPMFTLSYGLGLYSELDVIRMPERFRCDLGVLGIIPVPLRKMEPFGSIGG
jgi:hypothetical protein